MKRIVWSAFGLLILWSAAFGADQPFLEVHGQTDRTALWVGDRFHYTVSVVHDPQVRFVTDNLQKSTLILEPFEVLDLHFSDVAAAQGRKSLQIDVLLTTYEAEPREIQIPSFNLFYFVDSATAASNADRPAETLVVPPASVVLRGTLPEDVSSIRDGLTPPATPFRQRAARPLAIGMFVVSLLLLTPLFVHGKKLQKAQDLARRRKRAQEELRVSMATLAARGVDSEARMAEFFEEASETLRRYVSAVSVTPTEGKTPRELAATFGNGNAPAEGISSDSARDIVAILQACERVRYASNEYAAGTELHSSVVERLRSLSNST